MIANLTITASRIEVRGLNQGDHSLLTDYLTAEDNNPYLKNSYVKPPGYKGYRYNALGGVAYTHIGFHKIIINWIQQAGYQIVVTDLRLNMPELTPEPVYDVFEHELYDHQKQCIDMVRANHAVSEGYPANARFPSGIIKAATNSGKDGIMMGIHSNYINARTLMIVDDVAIANKAIKEFVKSGYKVGAIMAGSKPASIKQLGRINVATPIIFANMVNAGHTWLLDAFDILLVDECHKISTTLSQTLSRINAPVRYGLSGTPLNAASEIAKLLVIENLGKIVYEIKNAALIEKGISRRPIIQMHHVHTPNAILGVLDYQQRNSLIWTEIEEKFFLTNEFLADSITTLVDESCAKADRTIPTVVFVTRIKQGWLLYNAFKKIGYNVGFASGQLKNTDEAVDRFNKGKIDILIGTTVIFTGLNMNIMEAAIFASGGKSSIQNLQKLGRANRRKEGHDTINIHDFWMSQEILDKHTRLRIKVYKGEGYEVNFNYAHDNYYKPKVKNPREL